METTIEAQRWWIATGELSNGGEKVLGPFESRDLALEVRALLERKTAPVSYWVSLEGGE